MSSKAPAKKKAPVKKATKAKKPAAEKKTEPAPSAPDVVGQLNDCPKGGTHVWKDEDGKRFCEKCFEPAVEPGAKNSGKAKKSASGSKAKPKSEKLSAIDAAAQILAEKKGPMTTREMIEAMAAQKLWSSPNGQTPHATLCSAILREIKVKGKDARFVKAERGKFALATN